MLRPRGWTTVAGVLAGDAILTQCVGVEEAPSPGYSIVCAVRSSGNALAPELETDERKRLQAVAEEPRSADSASAKRPRWPGI